jgi:FixJ family two-component response regulator
MAAAAERHRFEVWERWDVWMSADPLISIVDNDATLRRAIRGLVRSFGFIAEEFESAAGFLKSDHLSLTRCLIAEVQMPEMTGLELHRRLVALGIQIPTVLITSYPDEATRARALKAGVNCYLPKPIKPDALLDCIRSALASRSG